MKINSKEYWDNRFDTDWKDYDGDKQTAFFADLLCEMLPDSVVKEIRENEYSVCDMGCALGEGVEAFCRKFAVDVDGMDVSEEAVKKAQEKYSGSRFWTGDLSDPDSLKNYDVVICSNVLEHFLNPWKIVKNLSLIASKYIIVMVPYKEQLVIEEHMYHFTENMIPVRVSDFTLCYVDTVDGNDYKNSYYPDQQILLVYKKNNSSIVMLNELADGLVKSEKRKYNKELQNNNDVWNSRYDELSRKNAAEIESLSQKLSESSQQLCEIQKKLSEAEEKNRQLLIQMDEKARQLQIQIDEKIQELENIRSQLEQACQQADLANIKAKRWEEIVDNVKTVCFSINAKTSYKLNCAVSRFVKQFILGSIQEKKKFLGICKRAITRERSEFTKNDGYNMILNIAGLLEMPVETSLEIQPISQGSKSVVLTENKRSTQKEIKNGTLKYLKQVYCKPDIIIFSVIDFNFRYQRPQHFASRFAENGHRVFYIDANFVNEYSVKELRNNLFVVNFYNEMCKAVYYAAESEDFSEWFEKNMRELIWEYAIKDAIIILDYPNWIYGAEFLRKNYGFRIIVDYMDDFTGFLGTTTEILKENCIHMLESSDTIVASSQFLCDIALKYNSKVEIVRNGTEVEHFYQAALNVEKKKRPVIGYYGAVAHWFAWEKVCYLAEQLPECDIVIIGEITEYREKLEAYANIKLLGEKKYAELPKYLAGFDVCLIPFDTSTDLIKATNPVKFYEYLSAGKRIVATEIPELAPYKDKYVYMSNENEKFLEYVKLCLSEQDSLEGKNGCIEFARKNDWQKRYEKFAQICIQSVPKISIIVLTYNNLDLNKACIASILNKTAYPNYELVVLDNMSTDGTVEYLKDIEQKSIPNVKIIFSDINLGFAGGNNKALKTATGDYIVLLNNDTVVTRGWLTNAVKHMRNDVLCGMCGAVTNSIGNEAMIKVDYKTMDELEQFAYRYTEEHNNEIYNKVDRLAMFCTMIRREIIDKYGFLDANYQIGMFEDDDYAKVVERAGYQFYIAEDVFIHHVNNASFKKLQTDEYKRIFEKNKKYFEEKWNTVWVMPQYRDGVTATINKGMMVEPREAI